MAIVASDIKVFLSGGQSNTNVNASLGGVPSTTEVAASALHNLWDRVDGDESKAGDTEYRIVYIQNKHASITGTNVRAYFHTNESSFLTIGVKEAINTNAGALTNENTAPTGITFYAAATKSAAVDIGDLAPNAYRALYIKRTIPAGTAADDSVDWNIQIAVDTSA